MMTDAQATLSDDQDISQDAGTYVSTNTIDLGAAPTDILGNSPLHDFGRGLQGLELLVQITEDVDSAGGNATVDFQLITSASADLGSPTVLQTTGAIAEATLVAGYQARLAIPVGIAQRYLGVQYVIAGETTTAGKAWAGLVGTKQTNPQV